MNEELYCFIEHEPKINLEDRVFTLSEYESSFSEPRKRISGRVIELKHFRFEDSRYDYTVASIKDDKGNIHNIGTAWLLVL